MQTEGDKTSTQALHNFEKHIQSLIELYSGGATVEPSVASRLTDYCLKNIVDVLHKSNKVAEFNGDSCIKVDHVKFALEQLEDRSKPISREELNRNAALRNQNKPPVNVEESKLGVTQLLYPPCTNRTLS